MSKTGARVDPKPAHALATKSNTFASGCKETDVATKHMTKTVALPINNCCLCDSGFLRNRGARSSVNADAAVKSCESAVLIIAAKIAAKQIPARTGGRY